MTRRRRDHDARLGDPLIDLYVDWREECSAVRVAYESWRTAAKEETTAAFAAYNAALDREERASIVYASAARQLSLDARLPA